MRIMKMTGNRLPALAELQQSIRLHASTSGMPLRALPHVTLMSTAAPTAPFRLMCEPTLTFVAQGRHHVVVGDRILECGPGQYLIIPVDLPLGARITEASSKRPFLNFRLALSPERISSLLLDAGTPPRRPTEMRGIRVSDAPPDLEDAIARLLRLLDAPLDLPVLAAAIEREIVWRLLNGAQGDMVRQIGLADSKTTRIGIAVRRIRDGYAEKLRIDELAKSAGMSVPSFHRHFRAVASMTPIQYQKNVRLHVARARLMVGSDDVSAVGFDVGYDSPSQFSREYKRLFGRPPGQDGAHLRRTD